MGKQREVQMFLKDEENKRPCAADSAGSPIETSGVQHRR